MAMKSESKCSRLSLHGQKTRRASPIPLLQRRWAIKRMACKGADSNVPTRGRSRLGCQAAAVIAARLLPQRCFKFRFQRLFTDLQLTADL